MTENNSCADKLVSIFDTAPNAARALKVDRQSVYQWVIKGYIPPYHALTVERATKGQITIREILEEAERVAPPKILIREVA